MNENEIRSAFEQMTGTVNPERVEDRVRERLAAKEREERKRMRFPRAAAVFACILMLTAVSAGAYGVYRNIFIQVENDGVFDYTAIFAPDDGQWETVALRDEVLAELPAYDRAQISASEGRSIYDVGKTFETWEDAAEWLDCGMLVSDLFGGIPGNIVFGGEVLLVSEYVNGELYFAEVFATNTLPEDMDAFCMTTVQIPVSMESDYFGTAVSLAGETMSRTEVVSYIAENGLDAEIAVTFQDYPDGRFVYVANAFLYHKGLTYDFKLNHEDRDTAVTYMKQILDSLH